MIVKGPQLFYEEVLDIFGLTHFLFHYLTYGFESRDEISFRGKDCNTPGVLNTKTVMSSYALQSIWSYCKL